ncbi:hypothetical protein NSA47_02335 [Irregularibacter muris]|uniref:Uncharacterized protein n=1 Tax=Irregularibacter muris TaxID=1796619 RepID=A0AAE3KYY5_9FIRM|nr:hypothetical protein [Irregularibacter muris]MCR1897826.1 hypothetical protein [Irregularibacter muris]
MIEKITLDMLNENSVSVKKQQYINHEGMEYPIGQPHRRAYVNSVRGRQEVETELPEQQRNAILSVWGGKPTVDESTVE